VAVTPDLPRPAVTIAQPEAGGELPPGPSWPRALQTMAIWAAPAPLLRWCRRRYGRTFTMYVAPFGTGVWVTDPADIAEVFTADPALVHAGEGNAVLAPILGERSILLSDEDDHLRRRRLMLPMFHGERVAGYRETMREAAAREVAAWRDGTMRLHPRMQALTLDIIMRAVLGVERRDDAPELAEALRDVIDLTATRALMWLWPGLGRVGPWKRYLAAQSRADRLLQAEIAARRADPAVAERADILSLLVQARYDDGSALDDGEVRDHLITLLLAGHETTATGLAWCFERLMRSPEQMERAVAAADAHDEAALANVAKETLRVRPVIVDVARRLTSPARFGGHDLPAGTIVFPSILLAHEGRAWADAHRFDAQRWEGSQPAPYSWIPFGGGVRRCLGAAFAQMEMQVVLGEVLRTVRLRAVLPAGEPGRVRHVTVAPAFGALARVQRRAVSRPA
jgi:cytochrome P450